MHTYRHSKTGPESYIVADAHITCIYVKFKLRQTPLEMEITTRRRDGGCKTVTVCTSVLLYSVAGTKYVQYEAYDTP